MVNCAGIVGPTNIQTEDIQTEDIKPEDFDQVLAGELAYVQLPEKCTDLFVHVTLCYFANW